MALKNGANVHFSAEASQARVELATNYTDYKPASAEPSTYTSGDETGTLSPAPARYRFMDPPAAERRMVIAFGNQISGHATKLPN